MKLPIIVGHQIQKLISFFYKPFSKVIPPETFRYGVTGGANTAFDILLYFIFYNFIFQKENVDLMFVTLTPHIAAFVFVFPITFLSGFFFAKYVTFTESNVTGRKQLIRYLVSVGGSIVLNYILLKLFVEVCHFWPTVSKIITTGLVIIYSYVMQRYFTFKTHA
jgi:putative flippase GtrA